MQMRKSLFRRYASHLTAGYFAQNDAPPATMEGYDPWVQDIAHRVERNGDATAFLAAIDWILAHPRVDASRFVTTVYPFDDEEVREILRYLRQEIFSDAGPLLPPEQMDFAWIDE